MKYNIEWKSLLTGQCGHGSKTWPRKIAERYAEMLTQKDPDYLHWVSPVKNDLVAEESSSKESNPDNTIR